MVSRPTQKQGSRGFEPVELNTLNEKNSNISLIHLVAECEAKIIRTTVREGLSSSSRLRLCGDDDDDEDEKVINKIGNKGK